jgi:hypothetical protein
LGLNGCGIGGLGSLLRFEVNFGLYPLFLGSYKLLVGLVEGAFGGGLVADEDSEVLGDGELDAEVSATGTGCERIGLEAEGAPAAPVVYPDSIRIHPH